eukprot:1742053-Amphidinium_carterae.1
MKNYFDSIDQVNNLREIQALRRLAGHPNIIKLHEASREGNPSPHRVKLKGKRNSRTLKLRRLSIFVGAQHLIYLSEWLVPS